MAKLGLGAETIAQLAAADVIARLKGPMADPAILKIGHNAKFDAQVLACMGVVEVSPTDDVMLLSYVLDGSSQDHALPALAERTLSLQAQSLVELTGTGRAALGFAQIAPDVALPYAAQRVDLALRLQTALRARLVAERQVTLYERIDRPLTAVVAGMETAGIKVDRGILARLAQGLWRTVGQARRNKSSPPPATHSISARPSSWATCCSARWACPPSAEPS